VSAGLLRCSVSLSVVACETAGDKILPSRIATLRPWNDVIEGQILRRSLDPAILAGTAVAQDDSLAGHGAILAWHPPVPQEPNHTRHRDVDLRSANRLRRYVLNHRGALCRRSAVTRRQPRPVVLWPRKIGHALFESGLTSQRKDLGIPSACPFSLSQLQEDDLDSLRI
jgi:hypothetical protein